MQRDRWSGLKQRRKAHAGLPLTCHVNRLNMKLISFTSWPVKGLRQHMRPARNPELGPSIGQKSCRSTRTRAPVTKHCPAGKFPSAGRRCVWTLESGPTNGPDRSGRPRSFSWSGEVTNVLFVCSANRLRSPTAEQVFSTWPGIETDSAGISNDADVPLSTEQVE
jgi:hypothetical protein